MRSEKKSGGETERGAGRKVSKHYTGRHSAGRLVRSGLRAAVDVAAGFQEDVDDLQLSRLDGQVERRDAADPARSHRRFDVGAGGHQQPHHVRVPVPGGQVERSDRLTVVDVCRTAHVAAGRHQLADDVGVTALRGQTQRRDAGRSADVRVRVGLEQK